MKIKLDENLPHELVPVLTDLRHDVDTVPAQHVAGRDDDVVWAAAQTADRFLVTQDLDFSDARKYAPGTHRLGAHVSGNQTTVTGRVTGDFPGSPVELQYHFTLDGDKIARLEIAP